MLRIDFSGWFQCRLATSPSDPGDEPRGVSGWTFAMPDEPDLDRIIRFQNPIAQRVPGPKICVSVHRVVIGEREQVSHPLLGASVNLLDDPVFVGRNGTFFEAKDEPIDPFHLEIAKDGILIRRKDVVVPGDRRVEDVFGNVSKDASFRGVFLNPKLDLPALRRRMPVKSEAFVPEVADATGIFDYADFRRKRADEVKLALESCTDDARKAALRTRLRELEIHSRRVGIREIALGLRLVYQFSINGEIALHDERGVVEPHICTNPAISWPIEFWMGAYDADALAGFVVGSLSIPFRTR